jgi:hypothetical protein
MPRPTRPSPISVLLAAALALGAGLVVLALGVGADDPPVARPASTDAAAPVARVAASSRPAVVALAPDPDAASADRVVVTGIVLDLDGAPRPTARVELVAQDGAISGTTVSDDDGRFAIPVELAAGGRLVGHVVARQAELVGSSPLFATAEQAPDDLELELVRGLELTGRVNTAGLPVEDVELVAERLGAIVRGSAPAVRARSSRDGSFRLPIYGAGVYQVVARRGAQRVEVARTLQVLDGAVAPLEVELPAAEEAVVVARRIDGAPLAGVAVKEGYSSETVALTDRDGVARFLAPRASASYVILVHDDYAPVGHNVEPGQRGEVVLRSVDEQAAADAALLATLDQGAGRDGADDEGGEGEGEVDDEAAAIEVDDEAAAVEADDEAAAVEAGDVSDASFTLALNYLWGDDGLVVLGPYVDDEGAVVPSGLLPGDVILSIDGVASGEGIVGALGAVRVRARRPATGREVEVTLPRDVPHYDEGC